MSPTSIAGADSGARSAGLVLTRGGPGTPGHLKIVPRLRVRRGQIVPHAGRGPPPQRARAGRRRGGESSRQCPRDVAAILRNLEVIPLKAGNCHRCRGVIRRDPPSASSTAWPMTIRPARRHPTRWQDVARSRAGRHQGDRLHQRSVCRGTARARSRRSPASASPRRSRGIHAERRRNRDRGRSGGAFARSWRACARSRWCWPPTLSTSSSTTIWSSTASASTSAAQERILLCLTPRANVAAMIETGSYHGPEISRRTDRGLRAPGGSRRRRRQSPGREARSRARGRGVRGDPGRATIPWMPSSTSPGSAASPSSSSGTASAPGYGRGSLGNPVDRLIRRSEGMDVRVFPAMTAKLKIFMGYAAGVGKTYQMLDAGAAPRGAGCRTSWSATSSRTAAPTPSPKSKASR